jgi:hypothetical protein
VASYFKANEEGEGHGDEDEEPADDGQDPSAHADPRVAILSCKISKEKQKNKVFGFIFSNWWRREKLAKTQTSFQRWTSELRRHFGFDDGRLQHFVIFQRHFFGGLFFLCLVSDLLLSGGPAPNCLAK